jgi:ABC-type uncharacterized transport system involved in gliding motility auxiliary subunit
MNKQALSAGVLVLAIALFFAVNILGNAALSRARVDLTEGKLYTLSDGSRSIAQKLDEPVTLTLYVSDSLISETPQIKSHVQRVKETLQEYGRAGGGKLKVVFVDPQPFSAEEDLAVQDGLAGVPVNAKGDRAYFGLVGTNGTGDKQVIPFFDPSKESFLEHDLTKQIYLLSNPKKKTIGLMAGLPMEGSDGGPFQQGARTPAWQIVEQMKEVFDVKHVATDATEIPAGVAALLIVHPKNLSDPTLYAIDQYVLKGGRAMVFVDPLCDADIPPGLNQQQMMQQMMQMPRNSDLKKLFDAWGVELTPDKVAADRKSALRVSVGGQGRPEPVDYLVWMGLGQDKDNLDKSDPVTGQIQTINMATAGALKKKDGALTTVTPLIQTSTDSMLVDKQLVQFIPDPKKLLAEFKPGGQNLMLAARISGKVKTAFPSGKPAPAPSKPGEAPKPEEKKDDAAPVSESTSDINVVVVADCDMLTDRFWVTEEKFGQFSLGWRKIADNGEFVIGALDNLSVSSDLMSVRARGRFARPFDKVKEIQKDAEQRFLSKEQELQKRLQETEQKISELQRKRPDAAGAQGGGGIILTAEQQQEIEKFRQDQVATRKELREVKHQLNQDIERLGTRLKFANMGLMPLMVGVAAVGLGMYRVNRRRGIAK